MQIHPTLLWDLVILNEIDSTNSEALRLVKSGTTKNKIIIANKQTAGRGRNNRFWHSLQGNLYSTLVLQYKFSQEILTQTPLVISLALHKTIRALIPDPTKSVKIKWPNDILVDGKKISGILIETASFGQINYLIIGVGVNILNYPKNIDQDATCLIDHGCDSNITALGLLEIFLSNFDEYFALWQDEIFDIIINIWLKNAYKLNESITIRMHENLIEGIFRGVDTSGSILLETEPGNICKIFTGDFY